MIGLDVQQVPWWTVFVVAVVALAVAYLEHGTPASLIEADECADLCWAQDQPVGRWTPYECECGSGGGK